MNATFNWEFPYPSKRMPILAKNIVIDFNIAQKFNAGIPNFGDTVYLTTADEAGMMVSNIQSNYMEFVSGVVIPGTGINLQNRGMGFNLKERHPN